MTVAWTPGWQPWGDRSWEASAEGGMEPATSPPRSALHPGGGWGLSLAQSCVRACELGLGDPALCVWEMAPGGVCRRLGLGVWPRRRQDLGAPLVIVVVLLWKVRHPQGARTEERGGQPAPRGGGLMLSRGASRHSGREEAGATLMQGSGWWSGRGTLL